MWPQHHHCFPRQQTAHFVPQKNQLVMALSTKCCPWVSTTDLYTDEQGNILTKGDVIFCKKQPFVVTEEGYIDHYSLGVMNNIFQAPDYKFKTLQDKVKIKKKWREVEAL